MEKGDGSLLLAGKEKKRKFQTCSTLHVLMEEEQEVWWAVRGTGFVSKLVDAMIDPHNVMFVNF